MYGMTKVVDVAGDYGYRLSHGEPVVSLVKWSSRGLIGADRALFAKRASQQLVAEFEKLAMKPGEIAVHLIALGGMEAYGLNRNGDGFNKRACEKYHNTFVKFARFYRDHLNRDPAISYGLVKASIWRPDMQRIELLCALNGTKEAADRNGGLVADRELQELNSGRDLGVSMSCSLDPQSPVLTSLGYKAISAISVGDLVLTHKGNWRRVTQLNRRRYTGTAVRFRVSGLPLAFTMTADHPFLAKRISEVEYAGCSQSAAHREHVRVTKWKKQLAISRKSDFGWFHLHHLQPGDRIAYRQPGRIPGYAAIADRGLAELMGIYLAEGSLQFNADVPSMVILTVNTSDWALRGAPALVAALAPEITCNLRPKANSKFAVSIEFYSKDLATLLLRTCGHGVRNKRIPPEIFNASAEIKLAFLGRWLDGDGWYDGKGLHWSTVNQGLALQGRDLLASLGISSSIYVIDHSQQPGAKNVGVEYTLNVSPFDLSFFQPYSAKAAAEVCTRQPHQRQKPAALAPMIDHYAYRIKEFETFEVQDAETYNFEVEADESYSLAGLCSHNCKIGFDVCLACGHKARHRGEYCEEKSAGGSCTRLGCKRNLTRMDKDGFIQGVDNPDPTWMDISHVFRPADRTAYASRADYMGKSAMLIKAAAEHSGIGGAQLAEIWGIATPLAVAHYTELPTGFWEQKVAEQLALARGLTSLEYMFENGQVSAFELRAIDPMFSQPIDCQSLGAPGSVKMAKAIGTLADSLIVLPLHAFAEYLGKSHLAKAAAELMPGVYTRMLHGGDLEHRIQNNAFAPGKGAEVATKALAETLEWRSWKQAAVAERAYRSAIRGASVPDLSINVNRANGAPDAEELARSYAVYKLASLHRMLGQTSDFTQLALLAVGESYLSAAEKC